MSGLQLWGTWRKSQKDAQSLHTPACSRDTGVQATFPSNVCLFQAIHRLIPRVISAPRKVGQDGSNSQKCLGETLMASYQWGHVRARVFMCRVCVRMCGLHSLGSSHVRVCICVCLLVLRLGLVRQEWVRGRGRLRADTATPYRAG